MRVRFSIVLALCLALVLAVPVLGHTTAGISPYSQSKASGQTAAWTVSWNGSGSTRVVFCYGDGSACPDITTSANSRNFSHAFYTCTNKTFKQTAFVTQGGHTYETWSYTTVSAGPIC